jgi:hypothetical protein
MLAQAARRETERSELAFSAFRQSLRVSRRCALTRAAAWRCAWHRRRTAPGPDAALLRARWLFVVGSTVVRFHNTRLVFELDHAFFASFLPSET